MGWLDPLCALLHPTLWIILQCPLAICLPLGLANGKHSLGSEDGGEWGRGSTYPPARWLQAGCLPLLKSPAPVTVPVLNRPSPFIPPGLGMVTAPQRCWSQGASLSCAGSFNPTDTLENCPCVNLSSVTLLDPRSGMYQVCCHRKRIRNNLCIF